MVKNLSISMLLFATMHGLVWISSNGQFVKSLQKNSLMICIALAIPTSLAAYYAARLGYAALGSAWSVRFLGFGLSYLVFPLLSWLILNESPFEPKTLTCIALSFVIVALQILWK